MTPYEEIIDLYVNLQQAYKWSPAEIDEQEIEIIFDEILVLEKQDKKMQIDFIDDFM